MEFNAKNLNVYRRQFIKAGLGFIGTTTLASVIGSNFGKEEAIAAENNITPEQALNRLMEGNKRFVAMKSKGDHRNLARLTEVAKGQNPFAAVLSCADSRVPVELLFDQGFGDIFVVRDAGNVATAEEIGSLEFGTLVLGAKVLMVIGHESCGAVKASMENAPVPGKISAIIEQIRPAVERYDGQQNDKKALEEAIKANVIFQMERLKKSTVISQLVSEGKLKVVGAYYDLDTGTISLVS